jgi:PTS system glucose-specific IIC component
LSSSIFGGIIVGGIVAYLYNKYKNTQLPKVIGFFSGVRFIPIITFGTMCVVGMLFAMLWPVLGLGFYYMGEGLSYGGKYGGITSMLYGIINRMLMPFGLHHVMNVMLWFSNVGGQINTNEHFFYLSNGKFMDSGYT